MSLVSSNPQPVGEVYVHMRDADVDSAECLHSCVTMFRDGAGGVVGFEILGAARVEIDGEPVTPQASSAERSEESLVSAVAEALRDFKFEVGPITFEMLKVGQAVYLTPEERHQIAHAAVRVYRQVMADE